MLKMLSQIIPEIKKKSFIVYRMVLPKYCILRWRTALHDIFPKMLLRFTVPSYRSLLLYHTILCSVTSKWRIHCSVLGAALCDVFREMMRSAKKGFWNTEGVG